MKSSYRALIAIGLSVGFFLLWYTVINPPKPVPPTAAASAAEGQAAVPAAGTPAAAVPPVAGTAAATAATPQDTVVDPLAKLPVVITTLKNDLVEADITTDGGVVSAWRVADYRQTTDKTSPPIDLAATTAGVPPPLDLTLKGEGLAIPSRPRFEVLETAADMVVLRWRSADLTLTKTITLPKGGYVADVAVTVENRSSKTLIATPELAWSGVNEPREKGGFFSFLKGQQADIRQPIYYANGKVHRVSKPSETSTVSGAVLWAGVDSRYFLSAVIPRVQGEGLAAEYGSAASAEGAAAPQGLWAGVAQPALTIPAGDTGKALFSVYAGPKDINLLKALNVRLDDAIDYGWFTVIAIPILYLLKFFYKIINNYGIAIILLTIFVKLLLHPVNVRSLKSMKAMQQLQPRLKELQQKFKNDKQRLNTETMQLFRAHKVNPMGGCLPMLLQLPIYIALYKVLWSSIELYHAPFFWFYHDLSAPDPYLITPILLGVFMVAQQLLTPTASADPSQKKMMMFMPVMFTGFMLFLPVGLVIYILVNTGMSVTQQWMYNKGIGFMDLVRGRFHLKTA